MKKIRAAAPTGPHAGKRLPAQDSGMAWSDAPLDYAIVNLARDDEPYRHSFDDIALPLCCSLRRMGCRAEAFANTFSSAGIHILLGLQDRPDVALSAIPDNAVIYNFERIEPDSKDSRPHYMEALRHFQVWECSVSNLQVLRHDFGLTRVTHVPFGYCPEMTRLDPEYPKDIDVLLYGRLNERRMRIVRELQAAGARAVAVEQVFGQERDFLIARSTIILNVHHCVPGMQEMARLGYLWANRKPVVCECNADTAIHEGYERACIYAPYEELVQKTLDCLRAPKALAMQAGLGFAAFSANDYPRILRECAHILDKSAGSEAFSAPVPDLLNAGSGKNFRRDALNIDIDRKWNPDLALDLSEPLDFTKTHATQRFGSLTFRPGMFKAIRAFDLIEHVANVPQIMKNFLDLLEEGGMLHINVPYDLSLGAWQDPTHLHAFNEESWRYYTDWAWYVNWRDHRFHVAKMDYVPSEFGKAMQAQGVAQAEIIRTPRAVDAMEVLLKKRRATAQERADYDWWRRAFYKDAVGEWIV
jgi:SAM-dependent methyltransferase